MALGENVVYAHWPRSFRVTIFTPSPRGGFDDRGMYPLLPPTVENNATWAWLTDQLVEHGVLSSLEAFGSDVEVYNGRSMTLKNKTSGERFMLLMPA